MSDLTIAAVDTQAGGRPCVRVFINCQHPEERWHESEYTEWELLDRRPETRGRVIDRAAAEHRENLAAEGVTCDCSTPALDFGRWA